MLVIAPLWLILLILCLSNRTGLKLFAVASVALGRDLRHDDR